MSTFSKIRKFFFLFSFIFLCTSCKTLGLLKATTQPLHNIGRALSSIGSKALNPSKTSHANRSYRKRKAGTPRKDANAIQKAIYSVTPDRTHKLDKGEVFRREQIKGSRKPQKGAKILTGSHCSQNKYAPKFLKAAQDAIDYENGNSRTPKTQRYLNGGNKNLGVNFPLGLNSNVRKATCSACRTDSNAMSHCVGTTWGIFSKALADDVFNKLRPDQLGHFNFGLSDNCGFAGAFKNDYAGIVDANSYWPIGTQITDPSQYCPGDFFKLDWPFLRNRDGSFKRNSKGNKIGYGHSGIIKHVEERDGHKWICFVSSQKSTYGIGERCEPLSEIKKLNVVRVNRPENLLKIPSYDSKNACFSEFTKGYEWEPKNDHEKYYSQERSIYKRLSGYYDGILAESSTLTGNKASQLVEGTKRTTSLINPNHNEAANI